jgi:negative regulator of sigma E activity
MDDLERLNAYLDGELPADEARAFEAELATNPALAKQLEEFRAINEALRTPFNAQFEEPIPDRFMRLLQDPVEQAEQPPAQIINFAEAKARREAAQSLPKRSLWSSWQARGAMAASVAALGLFALTQLQPGQSTNQAIETALNQTPSGIAAKLTSGETLTPRLSFVAKDGRPCREFDLAAETSIACLSSKGWQIEGKVKISGSTSNDSFGTAAGSGEALDAIYARLGAGDPLDSASERALIARNWK